MRFRPPPLDGAIILHNNISWWRSYTIKLVCQLLLKSTEEEVAAARVKLSRATPFYVSKGDESLFARIRVDDKIRYKNRKA